MKTPLSYIIHIWSHFSSSSLLLSSCHMGVSNKSKKKAFYVTFHLVRRVTTEVVLISSRNIHKFHKLYNILYLQTCDSSSFFVSLLISHSSICVYIMLSIFATFLLLSLHCKKWHFKKVSSFSSLKLEKSH